MICGPRIGRFPEYRSWRKPWSWLFGEKHDDQYYRVPQEKTNRRPTEDLESHFSIGAVSLKSMPSGRFEV